MLRRTRYSSLMFALIYSQECGTYQSINIYRRCRLNNWNEIGESRRRFGLAQGQPSVIVHQRPCVRRRSKPPTRNVDWCVQFALTPLRQLVSPPNYIHFERIEGVGRLEDGGAAGVTVRRESSGVPEGIGKYSFSQLPVCFNCREIHVQINNSWFYQTRNRWRAVSTSRNSTNQCTNRLKWNYVSRTLWHYIQQNMTLLFQIRLCWFVQRLH